MLKKIAVQKNGKINKKFEHGWAVMDLDTGQVYRVTGYGNRPQCYLMWELPRYAVTKIVQWLEWVAPRLAEDPAKDIAKELYRYAKDYITPEMANWFVAQATG